MSPAQTKSVGSLPDGFKFKLFGNNPRAKVPSFKGYLSALDPTSAPTGAMIGGSQNTYKKLNGNVGNRPGLKRRGEPDGDLDAVVSSYEWYTSLGAVRVLRVLASGLVQVESTLADGSTILEYDLLDVSTNTRLVFDTVWDNSLKKDFLIFVNGTTSLFAWHGGMGKIASTTMNTIVLSADAATQGFAPTGDVVINGNSYTYTGVSGATLTGVTGDPTVEPNGSIVMSAVIENSDTPDASFVNDFVKTIGNQVHVGSYNSRLIYVSSQADYTDYSVPSPRAPGDPDLLTLDSQARGIGVQKGSSDQSGHAVISGGLGDWYTVLRENVTVGSTLTEQVTVVRSQSADLATALAHEFIENIGDTLLFIDQNNQLRQFGLVRNITDPVYPLLSLDVFTELQNRDFTGGHMRAVADEGDITLYITTPNEGIDYMYQIRQKLDSLGNLTAERLWQAPMVRSTSRIAVIDGVVYGYSNVNPQMYQFWDTGQFYDDSPDDEEIPYESHAVFAYMSLAERFWQLFFSRLAFEGYCTPGTNLYCNLYLEYQGSKGVRTITINKPNNPGRKVARFFGGNNPPSLGQVSLGQIPLGDGIQPPASDSGNNMPKFRAIRYTTPKDVYEFALDIFTVDVDSQWELELAGINMQHSPRQPTGIMEVRGG